MVILCGLTCRVPYWERNFTYSSVSLFSCEMNVLAVPVLLLHKTKEIPYQNRALFHHLVEVFAEYSQDIMCLSCNNICAVRGPAY